MHLLINLFELYDIDSKANQSASYKFNIFKLYQTGLVTFDVKSKDGKVLLLQVQVLRKKWWHLIPEVAIILPMKVEQKRSTGIILPR
jgi:hypothetical protein